MKKPDVWVVPISKEPDENVWVVLAEARVKGRTVRTVRVFTTEPPDALVDYQRQSLHEDATAIVLEVAADHFDADELAAVSC